MVGADVRNDPNRGANYFTQPGGLPEIVDSHLDDRSFVSLVKAKQRLRDAHTVIQIPFRLENLPAMGHDAGDHFFRRRLTVASRHGNDRNVKSASVVRSQLLIDMEWIADPEDKWLGPLRTTLQGNPRHIVGIEHDRSNRPA